MPDHSSTDHCQRFIFSDMPIRGERVQLSQTLQTILGQHEYPMAIQHHLADMLCAVTLLSATLKFEGKLSIQAQGEGPLTMMLAECTHNKEVRATAQWNTETEWPENSLSFPEALGKNSRLAVTITPTKGKRYQGVVPLNSPSVAGALEEYFSQSEQLGTRLIFASDGQHASGMLLQQLPANTEEEKDSAETNWQHVTTLANTLNKEELLSLPTETLLHRLYHQEDIQLFDSAPVIFKCTCTRQKTEQTLLSLGLTTLQEMAAEDDKLVINCHFCSQEQHFDAVDLAALMHQLKSSSETELD